MLLDANGDPIRRPEVPQRPPLDRKFIRSIDRQVEVMHEGLHGGFVTVQGGPPCVIVETWEDEALIKAIADGNVYHAGQEWVVKKSDLMDAEVMFVEAPGRPTVLDEPDWNQIVGREREYSKNAG